MIKMLKNADAQDTIIHQAIINYPVNIVFFLRSFSAGIIISLSCLLLIIFD